MIDILKYCQAKEPYWKQITNKYACNNSKRKQQHTWIADHDHVTVMQ